jgi:proteasome lid subunit RPN8/RPN11
LSTPFRLLLPQELYAAMVSQAVAELPNECCGLLAGQLVPARGSASQGEERSLIGHVVQRYPLVNAAASPREYLSDPHSMFAAVRDMRRRDIDILAVYHSHPTSEPVPSQTDLERNWWPGVISLIVSLKRAEPAVRAWWLMADSYHEAEWECVA